MKHHETNQDNLHKCMNAKFGLTIQLFCHPHHLVDLQVLLVLDEDPEELPQGLQPNAHGLLLADHWWTTRCWLTWIHIIIRHDNVTMCSCHLQWPATKIEQSNNEQWTWTRMQQWTVNSEQCTLTITNICYKFDLCNINLKGPWGRSTAQHHSAWHGRSGEHSWRSSKCLPSKSGGDSITISLPSFLNVYTTKPHLHLARTRSSQLGADLGTSLRPMPCAADGGSAAPWTQATPRCSPAEQGHFH